jgi:exopolysaccharide biosynthesis operon protein EpsL
MLNLVSLRRLAGVRTRVGAALTIGLVALAAADPANAFDEDTFGVTLFANDRYDSNLFNLPDGVQPFTDGRRSATTRSLGIGLNLDKTYGLQHFHLSGNVAKDHYSPYDFLDTTSRVLNASWQWTFTPSLTGVVSISRTQAPNNFSDTGVITQTNLRKVEDRTFSVDYRPGAAIHPRLSVLQDEDKSQQQTFNRQNAKTTSLEGGIVYDFRSGNEAQLYFRRGSGNYINVNPDPTIQQDSQFQEHEIGLAAHYLSNGVSSFDGRIGYLSRDNKDFSSRNFGGVVGQLTYTYIATGKTQLQLMASRALASTQDLASTYSQDTTVSLDPIWSATSKITVRPSVSITRRTFQGAIVPIAENLQMTLRDFTFRVDWNVYRSLTLTFAATKENRSSNNAIYRFSDNGASVRASVTF